MYGMIRKVHIFYDVVLLLHCFEIVIDLKNWGTYFTMLFYSCFVLRCCLTSAWLAESAKGHNQCLMYTINIFDSRILMICLYHNMDNEII
jgi:hypothetical protein